MQFKPLPYLILNHIDEQDSPGSISEMWSLAMVDEESARACHLHIQIGCAKKCLSTSWFITITVG